MDIDLIPTLIDQYRETFEGAVQKWTWIVDAKPGCGVFALLEGVSSEEVFTPPPGNGYCVAAHAAHLLFSLELMLKRMHGENPPADWAASFDLPEHSPKAWGQLKHKLRVAYDAVLARFNELRDTKVQDIPPIYIAGLAAMTAHNAYHLGAMRQTARVVGDRAGR